MSESILNSTKKILGLDEAYTAFDLDVMMNINSALSVLTQIGVGPSTGMMIEDATADWSLLGTDIRVVNEAKQYIYLAVRAVFDPPSTSYGTEAMKEQIAEHVWRLNVLMEETIWTDPNPPDPLEEDVDYTFDGGTP